MKEKTIAILYTDIITMQVNQNEGLNKKKLSYVVLCFVSGSKNDESKLIEECTSL